ncbi:uncharacterized protein LOC131951741 [Physella acuta]|uniref:uncharacterized protein LOC131951741 n=1 Tax=Physella acuta TaxID=109671 RepID=UPI0027DC7885|nr:uncharacterized protein LOC131951741 [Physella acuta]
MSLPPTEKREKKDKLSQSSPDVAQLQVYSTDGRTIYYSQSQQHMTFSRSHHEDVSHEEPSYHRSQGGEAATGSLFGVSRRKRCASGHSEDSVEDLYEDLHRHQVHDNNWWDKKSSKKKKRHNHQYADSHSAPSNQSPKYELRVTKKRHTNWGTEESSQSNKRFNEQRGHSYQKNKMKPSTSWPTLNEDKKQKNARGFRAKNKNFMAIKSNCDRRVQLRK